MIGDQQGPAGQNAPSGMHMIGNVGVERTGRGRDPGELVDVERHQQNADGGNQKSDGSALARQREDQRYGHDGSAGGRDDSYGLSQSLARRQRAGLQSIRRGCWRLWRGRGGRIYQPYRSIAKFHPLILASDLSELFRLDHRTQAKSGESAAEDRDTKQRRQHGNTNRIQHEIPEHGTAPHANIHSILCMPPNSRRRCEYWRAEKYLGDNVRIASINLIEPAKSLVEKHKPGSRV